MNDIMNSIVEKTFVDGINKIGESLKAHDRAIADMTSTAITITLEDVDWEELAKEAGKKSALGAAIDGAFGLYKGALFYKNGHINKKTFAKYLLSEVGCGFITSTMGNIGSITVKILTGNQTASVIVGVGVSSGTRWIYRQYMPQILPDIEKKGKEEGEDEEAIREILDRFRGNL